MSIKDDIYHVLQQYQNGSASAAVLIAAVRKIVHEGAENSGSYHIDDLEITEDGQFCLRVGDSRLRPVLFIREQLKQSLQAVA